MTQRIVIHARINRRHKNISSEDVLFAWKHRLVCQMRTGPWPPQYVAVGFDGKGRALQMVAVYDSEKDSVLVFHAMHVTPGVIKELGLE